MGTALDRTAIGAKTRPQVGRFYGDFLCMRSFRKNTFLPTKLKALPDFLFRSKASRQFDLAASLRKPLESLAYFDGK